MKVFTPTLKKFKVFLLKTLIQVVLLSKKRKKRSLKILYHVNKIIRSSEVSETGKLDLINKLIHQLNPSPNNLLKVTSLKAKS